MKKQTVNVHQEYVGERIDKYLHESLDFSRSRVQNLIKSGDILVNGEKTKNNYKLKIEDSIDIYSVEMEELEVEAENISLDVAYEDSDVIVINKAKGIVVHPAPGNLSGTLVNALLYYCKDLSGINGVLRPGIVHRIDKDTTGLIIVAKNDKAHESLSKQLQSKSVSRKYYALVHGVIEHEFGTIEAPIGRDVKDRKKMAVCEYNSKDARTHFKVVERFKEYTLVECSLETGRTHQIRVHMQYINHPIAGDETYSYKKTMQTNGQLLHAHELRFLHPTSGEEIIVEAELPKDFADILEELRKD